MVINHNQTETEKRLTHITNLISEFNKSNDRFVLEMLITKKETRKYLTLDQIMDKVCQKFKTTPEYIRMPARDANIVLPRQICHYMAEKHSKKDLSEIGFYFGGKDHATVLNSKKKINNLIATEKEFRDEYLSFLNDVF